MKNDLSKIFSKGIIITHWLTALLILMLFPLGKFMEGLQVSEKTGLIKIHIILGLAVLVLTIIRSFLFFRSPRPEDLKTGSRFNDKLTVWIHNVFYFLLFAIAISGIATMILGGYTEALKSDNFGLIKVSDEIPPLKPHGILALIMMILLFMHIVGVIKHYIISKENTLKRIL